MAVMVGAVGTVAGGAVVGETQPDTRKKIINIARNW
jgi:hypothetical protein